MPGDLIKKYTSQADWQSGTSEGLDLTSRPGDIVPTADYIKQYLLDADWNAGTKAQTAVAGNQLSVAADTTSFTASSFSYQSMAPNTSYTARQRITARGMLTRVGWYCDRPAGSIPVTFELVKVSNGEVLFSAEVSMTTFEAALSIQPNVVLTEDVYVQMRYTTPSSGTVYIRTSQDSNPLLSGNFQLNGVTQSYRGRITLTIQNGYFASGTWTSPWLAHGKGASPASSWLSWVEAALPSGSGIACHVRWSADNGATYGAWLEVQNGAPLPGPTAAYLQIRLTLTATPDLQDTPVVSRLSVLIGELHRWTSPAIDITDNSGPKLVSMLTTGLQASLEVKIGAGAWQPCAGLVDTGSATTMQVRVTLLRTGTDDQYLSELTILAALILQMLDEPTPSIRPPEVTDVICYVESSEPLIEVTASLPGVPADKRIEVRISVPAGSSQSYAQSYANAYLAVHGVEKRSLTCRIPLCTRIGFGELVAIAYPPWGYGNANPWLAMVQEITHRPLASPPVTELILGDYQPDDTEALVQLIARGG